MISIFGLCVRSPGTKRTKRIRNWSKYVRQYSVAHIIIGPANGFSSFVCVTYVTNSQRRILMSCRNRFESLRISTEGDRRRQKNHQHSTEKCSFYRRLKPNDILFLSLVCLIERFYRQFIFFGCQNILFSWLHKCTTHFDSCASSAFFLFFLQLQTMRATLSMISKKNFEIFMQTHEIGP